jgi:hypothetical protein
MAEVKSPESIYPPRAGCDLDRVFLVLSAPPERPLLPERVAHIKAFDGLLTRGRSLGLNAQGRLEEGVEGGVGGIEQVYDIPARSHTFFPDYFLTEPGLQDLRILFPEAPQFDSLEECRNFILRQNLAGDGAFQKRLQEVCTNSRTFAEERMLQAFQDSGFSRLDLAHVPTRFTVIEEPLVLLDKVRQLRILKNFLRRLERQTIDEAEQCITRIHRRRVNLLLAAQFSRVLTLIDQLLPDDPRREMFVREIEGCLGGTMQIDGTVLPQDTRNRRLSQMDKFDNGVGILDETGDFGIISTEVEELLEELLQEQAGTLAREAQETEPLLPPEARAVKVNAEIFKTWIEEFLSRYGYLSEHAFTADDLKRGGTAPDGKWQVVIHPASKTLSVNRKQRIIKVPPKFDRELFQDEGGGAIQIMDHELGHLIQFIVGSEIGLPILDRAGTGRTSAQHEAGAFMWEGEAAHEFFGEPRRTNARFLQTALVRLRGGTYGDCVKAFFDGVMHDSPGSDKVAAAELAIDRAQRLFRNGGDLHDTSRYVFDSQPLAYVEQELIIRAARRYGLERLLLVGNVNFQTLAELHTLGIVDISALPIPDQRPSQVIKDTIVAYAQEHMRAAS